MIKIGFLEIGIGDILDILLAAVVIYQIYKLLRGSLAFNIFIGLILLYLMSFITKALEMNILATILDAFLGAGFVLLVIVFQPEIRRFLFYLGRNSGIGKDHFWRRLINRNEGMSESETQYFVAEISKAINNLANTRTGCLIVFTDEGEKQFFASTGVAINGEISSKLIESIFDKNTPLHDGALVIADRKISAAGCVLPVSESPDLPKRVGMRHRAAVGVTENIDAHVLIVSEETGKISYAKQGRLRMNIAQKTLIEVLEEILKEG